MWGALGYIAAVAISGLISWFSTKSTNDSNKEIMQEQQDWNEKMMDKQNEYNSESAKMSRLKEAGVNPGTSLMQTGGLNFTPSASANPTSLLPYVDPMTMVGNNLLSVASAFNQSSQGRERESLLELHRQQIQRQNEVFIKTAEGMSLSNEAQSIVLKYADAREAWSLRESKSRVWKSYAEKRNLDMLTEESAKRILEVIPQEIRESMSRELLNVYDAEKVVYEIKDLEENVKLKKSQEGVNQAQQELIEQQSVTEGIKQREMSAEAHLKEQEDDYYSRVTDRYLEKLSEETRNIARSADKTEEEIYWYTFDEMAKWKDTSVIGSLSNVRRQKQVIKTLEGRLKSNGNRVYHPTGHEVYRP